MPPRKRAASAPKADETLTPETEPDGQQDDTADVTTPVSDDSAGPADDSAAQAPADDGDQQPSEDDEDDEDDPELELSDLQTVDLPCTECCPNGWPEGAFSVGCIHGTYIRNQD